MRPLASATAQDIALTTHWSSSSSMRGNQRKWPQWGRFGNHHRCRHQQHWRYLCRSDRGRYTEKGNVSNTIPRPKSAESRGRQPQQHRIIPVPKFSIDLFEKRKAAGNPGQGNWMARNQTSNTVLPSTFQFASHTRMEAGLADHVWTVAELLH